MRGGNGHYLEIGDDFIKIYQDENLISELIGDSKFSKIQDAWIDKNNILWIADSSNSLLKYENFEFSENIKPSGPASNIIENIKFQDGFVFVAHNNMSNTVSRSEDMIDWTYWDQFDNAVCFEKIGNKIYFGSSSSGLWKKDGGHFIRYTNGNTQSIRYQLPCF